MFLFSLFLLFSPVAIAQDDNMARAEELFYNGQLLFEDEEYKAAITAWEQGYEISKMPDFLKNITLAQEALGQYDEAIQTLNQYRALASFDDQEELKVWMEELKQKQAEAETEAQERQAEKKRIEEAKKQEQAKIEEEKRLQKEQELAKEEELILQKEALLKKEQELANKKKFELPPKLPMWTSIGGTVLASGAAIYFTTAANSAKENIEVYCEWGTGACLYSELTDFNQTLQGDIDSYNNNKNGQIIASGLAITLGAVSIWQVSSNLSATPTSITWSTTW